ncbi:hypothetical protein A2T98_01760 [Nodularia spumigena CENA596]|uniref:Uncharacterized protein n=1 Tax=Nodularia spumigena CENA596 TaxID=1819295 RepID=A0A166KSW1_NODSP|nr:hypothetical protein A2T98_01760 [Nodularia spumigena CENA596]
MGELTNDFITVMLKLIRKNYLLIIPANTAHRECNLTPRENAKKSMGELTNDFITVMLKLIRKNYLLIIR